ncbi:MAG: FeoC-like transcriptional regulator [Methylococcales bacterium]
MILTEIEQYMRQRRQSTLVELSQHFGIEQDALRSMLDQWVRKGKMRKVNIKPQCQKTCDKCNASELEFYEWVDNAKALGGLTK